MNEIEFRIYKKLLKSKSMIESSIPKKVLNSQNFKNLIENGTLKKSRAGRGLRIEIVKEETFKQFFTNHFPEPNALKSKSGNIKKYRDSKASQVKTDPIFLLRGFRTFEINKHSVDILKYTLNFGIFSVIPCSVIAKKICFIENLEPFLNAEKLLGKDYLFIHKYGRIGKESIKNFEAEEILVFVDYDFNGLDEYLRIKAVFQNAQLYFPNNYDELFEKYSVSLKQNKAKMSHAVKISHDPLVIKIREQVLRNNQFLEQEVLIHV